MRLLVVCTVLGISLASVSLLAAEQNEITIRVLYDNCAHNADLQTDWGFSCLVTGTEKTILFDTGAKGDVLLQNMAKMSETQVNAVIAELKTLGVQKIGPTHCTGEKAIGLFKAAFGDGFVELGVGRVLQIGKDNAH
jgi:metal-dependent hydrolase (beta-lactamase superfamily II)